MADEPCSSGNSIDLLIGSDFYWNFVNGETNRGKEGPMAVNSALGWLLSGPISGNVDRSYDAHTNLIIDYKNSLVQLSDDDILANSFKGFWEIESIAINDLTTNVDGKNESFEIDVNRTVMGARSSCLGKEIAARLLTASNYACHDYGPCITSYAKNRPCFPSTTTSSRSPGTRRSTSSELIQTSRRRQRFGS